jgi:hypothetical protein
MQPSALAGVFETKRNVYEKDFDCIVNWVLAVKLGSGQGE